MKTSSQRPKGVTTVALGLIRLKQQLQQEYAARIKIVFAVLRMGEFDGVVDMEYQSF